jgi:dTDP-N-acetylfucosamine:lipid II N-acetylfucosaminyltransferase
MIKILHITIDDKFIDSANRQFERIYPGSNKFYIIIRDNGYPLQYIKMQPNFELLPENNKSLTKILNEIKDYDLVVFHGLDDFRCKIVLRSDNSVKFLWSLWGYEIYNFTRFFKNNIYGDQTKKVFKNLIQKSLKRRLTDLIKDIPGQFKKTNRFKAIKKIKYFGFPYEEEFTSLNNLKLLNAAYVRFTYYPLEHIISDHENVKISGSNILVGNSATTSNNHLEVFEKLKCLSLGERKVIVPLSYGSNNYRDEILKLKTKILPRNFQPLVDFYGINEYNNIIRTCSVFIMNSYRQQGIGNIFAMLWMGARVYLDERNTTYTYLKRKKLSVFSISNDLVPSNENIFKPLDLAEIERNREILRKELSEDILKKELKSQIDKIVNSEVIDSEFKNDKSQTHTHFNGSTTRLTPQNPDYPYSGQHQI